MEKNEKSKCDLAEDAFLGHLADGTGFSVLAGKELVTIFPISIILRNYGFCRFIGRVEDKEIEMEINFFRKYVLIPSAEEGAWVMA